MIAFNDAFYLFSIKRVLILPLSTIFLPDGRALVSERPGRIRLIKDGKIQKEPYAIIENALPIGEGGLMGLATHPDFPHKPYIYAMHTYKKGDSIFNRVTRLKDYGTYKRSSVLYPIHISLLSTGLLNCCSP